jgi:hypothetical protein
MPEDFQIISQLLIREPFHSDSTRLNWRKFRGSGTPLRTGGFIGSKIEPGVIE